MTAVALLVAAAPGTAQAQLPFRLGGQISWGDDSDVGIGVRYENNLTALGPGVRNLRVIGSFDWFFPGDVGGADVTYWEINANLAWAFRIPGSRIAPYAGGGLNIARVDVDAAGIGGGSNTDVGLNLLGGLSFPSMGKLTPYVEMRVELSGGEQFVLTAGLLFF
jgi:opacity protein-like surface antigen